MTQASRPVDDGADWQSFMDHEPVERDGYGLSCTACDWVADYSIEPGYGWAAHVVTMMTGLADVQ